MIDPHLPTTREMAACFKILDTTFKPHLVATRMDFQVEHGVVLGGVLLV